MDPFSNDQFFVLVTTLLIPFIVELADKIPVALTTDRKPFVAAVAGGIMGLCYWLAPVYDFLNRAPVPEGSTPAMFFCGGVFAGLAGIGLREITKNAMPR